MLATAESWNGRSGPIFLQNVFFYVSRSRQKKSAKFFLRLPDTYKKYILQKKWSKTVIPALSSGQHNLQTLIGGCHHQLDVSSKGRPTTEILKPFLQFRLFLSGGRLAGGNGNEDGGQGVSVH